MKTDNELIAEMSKLEREIIAVVRAYKGKYSGSELTTLFITKGGYDGDMVRSKLLRLIRAAWLGADLNFKLVYLESSLPYAGEG